MPHPPPGALPDPGIEPSLLNCKPILYHLDHQGRPHCWSECKLVQSIYIYGNLHLWKIVWWFLTKIKSRTTIRSSKSTSGYVFKGNESSILKRELPFRVHSSTIHNGQDTETTQVFISGTPRTIQSMEFSRPEYCRG